MVDMLYDKVRKATLLPEGYKTYASYRSMDAYLKDWEFALRRLTTRVDMLRQLRDARQEEEDSGVWPERVNS